MSNVPAGDRHPRLSVALIVRDAESVLAQTLASVQGLADEIMVLDTGSTDHTMALAANFGAQVFSYSWTDDFSAARNALWSRLTGDWILWLDAGERLTGQSASELRDFVRSQADHRKAYMMLIAVPAAEGEVSGEQVGRIRLVPNRSDLRFAGRVRESVRRTVDAAGMVVEGIPWRILRAWPEYPPNVKLARARRDLRLLELEFAEQGPQPRLEVALGETQINLGDRTAAAAAFARGLRMAPPGSTAQREAFYGMLTCLDAGGTERRQQINTCLAALEIFPLDAQLLCAIGGYLQAEGRLDLAMRSYETAYNHGQVDPESWHVPDIREIAAVCWSLTLQLQDQDEAALAVLEQALKQTLQQGGGAIRIRRHSIDLYIKHNRRQQALAQIDQLPADTPHREALRSAVRGACLAAKQDWPAALTYLQTAHQAGCRDIICLRWLAITLMAMGNSAAAEEILRQWNAVDPRSSELHTYMSAVGAAPAPPERIPAFQAVQQSRRLRIDAAAVAAGTAILSSGTAPHLSNGSSASGLLRPASDR